MLPSRDLALYLGWLPWVQQFFLLTSLPCIRLRCHHTTRAGSLAYQALCQLSGALVRVVVIASTTTVSAPVSPVVLTTAAAFCGLCRYV